MPWVKGQSGNTKGRPPKSRALTELLERTGKKKTPGGVTGKQEFAERLWEGLTTGSITFSGAGKRNGRIMTLEAPDFIALAKLVLSQIDGPPPAAVDVTSAGQPVNAAIIINGVPSRGEPPSLEDDTN